MNIFRYVFDKRNNDADNSSLFGDEMRNKTNSVARNQNTKIKGFVRNRIKTAGTQKNSASAYVRIGSQGSVHIPSSEIAELPEVKAMQLMAMRIVSGKR